MKSLHFLLLVVCIALQAGCTDDKSAVGASSAKALAITIELLPANIIGGGQAGALGSGSLALGADNILAGEITFANTFIASGISLGTGFAGEKSSILTSLQSLDATRWKIPDGFFLSPAQRDLLISGGLHLLARSISYPEGATRGQLLVPGVEVYRFDVIDTQVVPAVQSAGEGEGFFTLNRNSASASVHANVTASIFSATINIGVAGSNGLATLTLLPDNQDAGHWLLQGQALNAVQIDAFDAALFYAQFNSVDFPDGELRGQIVPAGFAVDFIALTGAEAVDDGATGVSTAGSGIAAATFASATRQLTVHVNTRALPTASAASLNLAVAGFNGPIAIELQQDLNDSSLWSAENVALASNVFGSVAAQATYYLVATPDYPDGEIRGQWLYIDPAEGVAKPPQNPASTLSVIQQNIFTPNCTSGCHSGVSPAAGQNLSAGQTFANVVDVPSEEVSLLRVKPGAPDESYLVQKIEGAAGIVGERMPLGEAPLSAQDILSIREWIANGANNN